jgi:sec-independent protein translocase protein TatC
MSHSEDIEDSSAPLIEHLAELRTRLIHSVVAFIIGMVICFTVATPNFTFLTAPLCQVLGDLGQDCGLIFISPQEGFFVAIKISFLGGFILAFPYIGMQMWRFVAPGLYKNEKNAFLPFLVASPFMFLLGASFAFFVVTPLAYDFFLGFQQFGQEGEAVVNEEVQQGLSVVFQGSAQEYLNLTIKFIVAFGLCFQLPVLLTLMGKAGLVSADGLKGVRKYAVVGILVLAALVTPPDVITQVILFVVVYGLYEISIHLVRRVERKREEQLRADGYYDDEFEDEFDDDEAAEDLADAADGGDVNEK